MIVILILFIILIILQISSHLDMLYTPPHKRYGAAEPTSTAINTKIKEFPYRRNKLQPIVKDRLAALLSAPAIISNTPWTIPNGKVNIKLQKNIFYTIPIVVKPGLENHWDYDQIIDYYIEPARVKTPGYGELYSVYQYWTMPELHSRWKDKDYDPREALYKAITEARPAYASVAISLYQYFVDLLKNKSQLNVLDIAAYGERAIAAANLGLNYYGIDPNTDLITGHTELVTDITNINPNSYITFEYIGLEDYLCSDRFFQIITYSPPPFNTEPYHGNKQLQSYTKYPTVNEYFCCFLTELIYKASRVITVNGVFSFTALDRDPDKFKIRIPKEYQSEYTTLIYVEALLLVVLCYNFTYHGAIGLAVGGKTAQVPWWTFMYTNTTFTKCINNITLFSETYPNWFTYIGARLISNVLKYDNTVDFNKYVVIDKTTNYEISKFIISEIKLTYEQKVFIEIFRYRIQDNIAYTISKLCNMDISKIKTALGRYLMMRSIAASFDKPWMSGLFVDPIFPTYSSYLLDDIEDYIINSLKCSNIAYIIKQHKFIFGAYECIGLSNLYDTIANFIQTVPLSRVEITITNNNTIIKGNDFVKELLNKYSSNSSNVIWTGSPNIDNLLVYLRYETLAARGHQFTRSHERTKILENIIGHPLIDIYASVYNNQSEQFCSIYPDVETNSIGSAFCLKMISGAYLANPVDVPVFLKVAIGNIVDNLQEAQKNGERLIICMAFTLWLDTNPKFIENFTKRKMKQSALLDKTDNLGLQLLSNSKFIRAIYILDKTKFPSILLNTVSNRSGSISVGVIMTSQSNMTLQTNNLSELTYSDEFYLIC